MSLKSLRSKTLLDVSKALIILSVFLIGNSIMWSLNPLTVGFYWYVTQIILNIIPWGLSFALGELRTELTVMLGADTIINLITLEDYLTGSNVLYDLYPFLTGQIFWWAMGAFGFYFIRKIPKLIKEYRRNRNDCLPFY